jgi:hypothetical protein
VAYFGSSKQRLLMKYRTSTQIFGKTITKKFCLKLSFAFLEEMERLIHDAA